MLRLLQLFSAISTVTKYRCRCYGCRCLIWAELLHTDLHFCICIATCADKKKMVKIGWLFHFFPSHSLRLDRCYHIFPHCAFSLWFLLLFKHVGRLMMEYAFTFQCWWMPISNAMVIEFYLFFLLSLSLVSHVYNVHVCVSLSHIIIEYYFEIRIHTAATAERQAT